MAMMVLDVWLGCTKAIKIGVKTQQFSASLEFSVLLPNHASFLIVCIRPAIIIKAVEKWTI